MKRIHRFVLFALLAGGAVVILSGCSSYGRRWKAAAGSPPADRFAGAWVGEWRSEQRGGSGRLYCILTPGPKDRYTADFKAHWHGLSSQYQVPLDAERRPEVLIVRGSHDLSFLFGGQYRYEGRITPDLFDCTYDSRYDKGRFIMRRAEQP